MPPATAIPFLNPSGEDANPLHKRLPAETVTRKPRPQPKKEDKKEDEDVHVDLKAAVSIKPDARPKWLTKACKMCSEGRASTTELYTIITSRKFLAGLPGKVGRRLRDAVQENLGLFSDKQQRFLKSDDWALNAKYGEKAGDDAEAEGGDAAREDDASPAAGDDKRPAGAGDKAAKARDPAAAAAAAPARARPREAALDEAAGAGDSWVAKPAAPGQEERAAREAALAEERAKRKQKEREEQERWMEAQAEASRRRAQEALLAQKRQLEDAVDSSIMLLEQLGQQQAIEEAPRRREVDAGRRGGLSRSRSVQVRNRSRRRRDRSRGRRRRSGSGSRPRIDFADALRRRLEEREANDTTRIPVVDPGHAARWAARSG